MSDTSLQLFNAAVLRLEDVICYPRLTQLTLSSSRSATGSLMRGEEFCRRLSEEKAMTPRDTPSAGEEPEPRLEVRLR